MTAAWGGWTILDAHLVTAAAALSQPIDLVRRGVPISVPTRMVRYWYDGIGDSPFSPGNTLSKSQIGLQLTVGIFLPIGGAQSADAEAKLDSFLEETDAALQAAIWGDAYLGAVGSGQAIGVEIGDSQASVEAIGGALVRVLLIPVTYGIADAADITP